MRFIGVLICGLAAGGIFLGYVAAYQTDKVERLMNENSQLRNHLFLCHQRMAFESLFSKCDESEWCVPDPCMPTSRYDESELIVQ